MSVFIMVIVVVSIVGGTVTTIVKAILNYLSSKHRLDQPSSSLTTSELQGFIRDAVEEATGPLAERVAELEEQLAAQRRSAAHPDLLEGSDTYEAGTALDHPSRKTVR